MSLDRRLHFSFTSVFTFHFCSYCSFINRKKKKEKEKERKKKERMVKIKTFLKSDAYECY